MSLYPSIDAMISNYTSEPFTPFSPPTINTISIFYLIFNLQDQINKSIYLWIILPSRHSSSNPPFILLTANSINSQLLLSKNRKINISCLAFTSQLLFLQNSLQIKIFVQIIVSALFFTEWFWRGGEHIADWGLILLFIKDALSLAILLLTLISLYFRKLLAFFDARQCLYQILKMLFVPIGYYFVPFISLRQLNRTYRLNIRFSQVCRGFPAKFRQKFRSSTFPSQQLIDRLIFEWRIFSGSGIKIKAENMGGFGGGRLDGYVFMPLASRNKLLVINFL